MDEDSESVKVCFLEAIYVASCLYCLHTPWGKVYGVRNAVLRLDKVLRYMLSIPTYQFVDNNNNVTFVSSFCPFFSCRTKLSSIIVVFELSRLRFEDSLTVNTL